MQKQHNNSAGRAKGLYPASHKTIFLFSLLASFFVLTVSLLIQWLIYDDLLHRTGPLRIVGTSMAAAVTFVFVFRWQHAVREKQREMVRRFEMIADMNDRIRNALQAIECVTYLSRPEETDSVRQAVGVIDGVLRDVIADAGQFASSFPLSKIATEKKSFQKPA